MTANASTDGGETDGGSHGKDMDSHCAHLLVLGRRLANTSAEHRRADNYVTATVEADPAERQRLKLGRTMLCRIQGVGEMVDQASARGLDLVEHLFKTCRVAVVRVGDIDRLSVGVELTQPPHR